MLAGGMASSAERATQKPFRESLLPLNLEFRNHHDVRRHSKRHVSLPAHLGRAHLIHWASRADMPSSIPIHATKRHLVRS